MGPLRRLLARLPSRTTETAERDPEPVKGRYADAERAVRRPPERR